MTLTLKATVRGGRLLLDEPIDLPEGAQVELLPVDEQGEDLDDADRAQLHAALIASENEVASSSLLDARDVIAGLRRV